MHAKRTQILGTNSDGQENLYLNNKIDIGNETILTQFFQSIFNPNTPKPAFSKSILPCVGPILVSRLNSCSNIHMCLYCQQGRRGGGAKYLGPGLVLGDWSLHYCQEGWGPVMRNHLLVLGPDHGSRRP